MKKKGINKKIIIFTTSMLILLSCLILIMVNIYYSYNPKRFVAPSKMIVYSSEYGHFSIKIPDTWKYLESGPHGNHNDMEEISEIFNPSSPYFNPQVTVSKRDFSTGALNDVINWGKARAEENNNYEQLSMSLYNTENYPGYINTYNIILGPSWAKRANECMDWYTLNKQTGYSFQFCALKVYWPNVKDTFDEMINSIEIKD